jgi:hypothetical protein
VALHVIADHPWLGGGVGTYPEAQGKHLTPRLADFNPFNVEAKNLYLNVAAEMGLLGLLLLGWVGWCYLELYHTALRVLPTDGSEQAFAVGLHAGLIALATASLVDTPILQFFRQPSTFALLMLFGVLVVFVHERTFPPEPSLPVCRRKRRIFVGGWIATGLILLMSFGTIFVLGWRRAASALPHVRSVITHPSRHFPHWTPLSEVAETVRDTVVASEDGHFYTHHGIDWQALHRALRKSLRAGGIVQGGGTITMQTARFGFLSRERTLTRKMAEMLLALYLERHLSKERILELYLNVAPFGLGTRGIKEAAYVYFDRAPRDLTLAEAAFLAGVLPEEPANYEAVTPALVQRARRRALRRLQAFFPLRYTWEELEQAQREPLSFTWKQRPFSSLPSEVSGGDR